MKNTVRFFSVVFLLFVFGLSNVTAEKTSERKSRVRQFTGIVKSIDASGKIITLTKTIKKQPVDTVFSINENTKFQLSKEEKAFSDVKVGDKVTIKYRETDGKNVAKKVSIRTSTSTSDTQ